jgi:hypothetical protein
MDLPKLVRDSIKYYILRLKYTEEKYEEYKKRSEESIKGYQGWVRMPRVEKQFYRLLYNHEFFN